MDYSLLRIISTALIFMITIPSSLGHRDASQIETNLRDLCSQTRNPKDCWKIIKSEYGRFNDTDSVAGIVIDLAIAKADEIHNKLNRLHEDSRNDGLKEKYLSCSKNYNDANRNLDLVKRSLNSNDYQNIPVQINDTLEELRSCRLEFNNDSFDPAHIRNRNKEFENYVDIVKVATDRLLREDDRNSLVMILIFVVFMLVISSSTAHKVSDTEIKHLCSKSNNPACCYKILKSDHRTANVDPKGLVEVSVDLASKKAHKIHSQLNSFFKATHDSQLRNLYNLCSKNYNGTIHDLEVVKINQHSGAYKNIHVQVKHASSVMILIFILFMLVTPSTTAHKVTDTEIKHLCSKSSNHVRCYKLINSNHRTANVDANGLVEASVDLASNKANKIHSQLNSFSKATHDSRLRELYNLCSKNYNETIHDIELVKNNLHSGAYKNIHVQVKHAFEEIKSCEKVFGEMSSDHAHIKKKSQDLKFRLNIVKITFDNLKRNKEVVSIT